MRLEVEETIDEHVLELLISELGVSESEVFRLPGPLDLRGLHDIADLDREDLKYPEFIPTTHPRPAPVESASPVDVFKGLQRGDVLLHHPYDSFSTSVQRVEGIAGEEIERLGRDARARDRRPPKDVADLDDAMLRRDPHQRLRPFGAAGRRVDHRVEERIVAGARTRRPSASNAARSRRRIGEIAEALVRARRDRRDA